MTEDLTKRVEQSASGITPQTCPDERRRFLGSLRERVFIRMSVAQLNDNNLCNQFIKHINDFEKYTILINGKIPQTSFISKVMELCSKKNIKFTIICDETAHIDSESTGILVISNTAINQFRINISQVYSASFEKTPIDHKNNNSKTKNLIKKLFNKRVI